MPNSMNSPLPLCYSLFQEYTEKYFTKKLPLPHLKSWSIDHGLSKNHSINLDHGPLILKASFPLSIFRLT